MSAVSEATTILVAVDHSTGSLVALARARSLAKVTGDSLIVCTVLGGDSDEKVLESRLATAWRASPRRLRPRCAQVNRSSN